MNARSIAFSMLKEICIESSYSNLLLRKDLDQAKSIDKGFITQMVYGTLQNYRRCRFDWECYAQKRPVEEICILLDMSVYQMFYMDKVPTYAIINEAVAITKKMIRPQFANMVNAILHNVERHGRRAITGSAIEQLSIETSHPEWIVYMWCAQYGFDTTERICRANLEIKPNAVRVNRMKSTKEALLQEDNGFTVGKLSCDAVWYHGPSLIHSTYYEEGLISIQDEASQMVAHYLDPKGGERILDVCSAPGTKSCHIAELMNNQGEVLCGDIHEHRVALIVDSATRLQLSILKPLVMDATTLKEIEGQEFDRVLCDVPCSGYGVLSRKSDIKYHMKSEDMDTLIPLQKAILACASHHVKKQGILVYSTCTLNKKENEKQVENFLKEHLDFELLEARTIFPYEYESDGFFMAKMQRR